MLCETCWHVDNGWASALQACKGDNNKKLLDQDKKGGSNAKEEVWFCSTFVVCVEGRARMNL